MAQRALGLGVDFGTSNTAAGYMCNNRPRLIQFASGRTTIPTTFFFDYDARRMLIGELANQALLDGVEGRFMRALKRVLGTSLMHERRQILNERVTFVDIVGRFLAEVKARAEAEAGTIFDRVLSGRPVVFHGVGDPREAAAEADLRACYLAAGFREVDFMPEPQAAAIASGALGDPGSIGLVVDVGGGVAGADGDHLGAEPGRVGEGHKRGGDKRPIHHNLPHQVRRLEHPVLVLVHPGLRRHLVGP